MQGLRRNIGFPVVAVVLLMFTAVMLPEVAATRYIVGGNKGWTTNVNYSIWARSKHFYKGDWLFFVSTNWKRTDVFEVRKKDYDKCNSNHPIHKLSKGYGRDVVPLNVTKTYYFISGRGFCYGGMKVAIQVKSRRPRV
ncbi:hypothetical protein BUALT_Bualt16G0019400 [Buddleja alternifolia]|uniref:Phytocyanin domain-containing protein n=1 Tax=Buddleja alternifolia TaxID=168488 RepID=A0AAV6WHM6_9LAMI|nr:hypothetical protein BUALT_Bualt16G0019400 [Buddleja alternifolia]